VYTDSGTVADYGIAKRATVNRKLRQRNHGSEYCDERGHAYGCYGDLGGVAEMRRPAATSWVIDWHGDRVVSLLSASSLNSSILWHGRYNRYAAQFRSRVQN
jgi:hypothetical protein